MRRMAKFAGVIGVGLVILFAVLMGRTLMFTSKRLPVSPVAGVAVSEQEAAAHLAGAIRYKTISCQDAAQFEGGPFIEFHKYLQDTFPALHAKLERQAVSTFSLLYCWPGSDPALKPIALLAHQDVVPVAADTEKEWTHPAFDGVVADGFVWGRGALDDKGSLMGILEAVDALLREGYQPKRTIYLAFGHDEEVGGSQGAPKLAETLASKKVRLDYVIDEGSSVVQGIIPGVACPVAVIGLSEKGYLSIELTVESEGGHSSTPPAHTAIGILANAITRIENHPFPANMTQAARFFEYVGPEMPFLQKMVFANLWLTAPLVERILGSHPGVNASIRTTAAATIFNAGVKENVLPSKAVAVVNFRILSGETAAQVIQRISGIIHDDRVKIKALNTPSEPSPISDLNAPSYRTLCKTIQETVADPETVIAPFMVLGATDSRHYASVSDSVYRFQPLLYTEEDVKRMHSVNERVSVSAYAKLVKFYAQLIKNSDH